MLMLYIIVIILFCMLLATSLLWAYHVVQYNRKKNNMLVRSYTIAKHYEMTITLAILVVIISTITVVLSLFAV